MAIIHGTAGKNAFDRGLRKQEDVLSAIFAVSLVIMIGFGLLYGLSFSRNWPTQWFSILGILTMGGVMFGLKRKLDRVLERKLREARVWRRGAEGERVIAELLESDLPDSYHVFNDVRFPGRTANIDHLVVGPSGVFVINTKNWRGIVGWADDGKTLLWNGEAEKRNSVKAALADALDVRDKIRVLLNKDVFVKAILAFPMAKVLPRLDTMVELQQDDYLIEKRLKYIDKRHELSATDVRAIANALLALFRNDLSEVRDEG